MEEKRYKLSPSDFAYLYEECKCCYYLKIKHGIQRPQLPFPGVFSALNTRLQGTLVGKNLQELSSLLPEGYVESQEGFVESENVPGTKLYIKGKYDLLVKQTDGTHLIVDFKISDPSAEKIVKYQTQLQAYHFAFEHPVKNDPIQVTKLGLIVMYPAENGVRHCLMTSTVFSRSVDQCHVLSASTSAMRSTTSSIVQMDA